MTLCPYLYVLWNLMGFLLRLHAFWLSPAYIRLTACILYPSKYSLFFIFSFLLLLFYF